MNTDKQKTLGKDIVLDVYQVIRLRHTLKKSTQELLKEKYLDFYLGPLSGLPIVCLTFNNSKETNLIAGFLVAENFWHSKEGATIFASILNLLVIKGYFALTPENKKNKKLPKIAIDAQILPFIGNLLYNFDSFNTFSKDERVLKTIYDDNATEEDFIYVIKKVFDTLKNFIDVLEKRNITDFDFQQLIDSITRGGEI